MNPVVFFDFETGGLERHHPNTQIAAIAFDMDAGLELAAFNSLIQFDENAADPAALALNHYDPMRWIDAEESLVVREKFKRWLNDWKSIDRLSKKNKPYRVARLGGYNVAVFDQPRLLDWFADDFLPASYDMLDVKFLASWYFYSIGVNTSLRLSNVCSLLGIEITNAHDALADVRATAAVAFELQRRM